MKNSHAFPLFDRGVFNPPGDPRRTEFPRGFSSNTQCFWVNTLAAVLYLGHPWAMRLLSKSAAVAPCENGRFLG